jgi:hypothetical protein
MTLGNFKGALPDPESKTEESNPKAIRLPPIEKLSDNELLRYGQLAQYLSSPEAGEERETREDYALQLKKVRQEWQTRFPRLPISSTFATRRLSDVPIPAQSQFLC